MERFDKVTAIFSPSPEHIQTLLPNFIPLIGEEAVFMYAWLENDDDMYPGVWALTTDDPRWLGKWIPEFDLNITGVVI